MHYARPHVRARERLPGQTRKNGLNVRAREFHTQRDSGEVSHLPPPTLVVVLVRYQNASVWPLEVSEGGVWPTR